MLDILRNTTPEQYTWGLTFIDLGLAIVAFFVFLWAVREGPSEERFNNYRKASLALFYVIFYTWFVISVGDPGMLLLVSRAISPLTWRYVWIEPTLRSVINFKKMRRVLLKGADGST